MNEHPQVLVERTRGYTIAITSRQLRGRAALTSPPMWPLGGLSTRKLPATLCSLLPCRCWACSMMRRCTSSASSSCCCCVGSSGMAANEEAALLNRNINSAAPVCVHLAPAANWPAALPCNWVPGICKCAGLVHDAACECLPSARVQRYSTTPSIHLIQLKIARCAAVPHR